MVTVLCDNRLQQLDHSKSSWIFGVDRPSGWSWTAVIIQPNTPEPQKHVNWSYFKLVFKQKFSRLRQSYIRISECIFVRSSQMVGTVLLLFHSEHVWQKITYLKSLFFNEKRSYVHLIYLFLSFIFLQVLTCLSSTCQLNGTY